MLTAGVKRGAPGAFVMGDMPFHELPRRRRGGGPQRRAVHDRGDGGRGEAGGGRAVCFAGGEARPGVDPGGGAHRLAAAADPADRACRWWRGRTPREKIKAMVDLAKRLVDAGAAMLLIEQATAEAAEAVIEAVGIGGGGSSGGGGVPVIGCGAGPACHGHVIVLQGLAGHDRLATQLRHPRRQRRQGPAGTWPAGGSTSSRRAATWRTGGRMRCRDQQ